MVRQSILSCLAVGSLLAVAPAVASGQRLTLFYDPAIPQAAFAAAEIGAAAAERPVERPLTDLTAANCAPCVVLAAGEGPGANVARLLGLGPAGARSEQAYSIRRKGPVTAVLAADATGVMYGGLDLAESLRTGGFATLADSEHRPHIAQRGIKFNIPLDARTPSYSDNATAAQENIPEMWSLDFWREFLDDMARHRYNVLSLWNLHPFPSVVKVPEYPEVALRDVKRSLVPYDETFTHTGSDMVRPETLTRLETVKNLTIEEKIAFWREVMRYAAGRGIAVYWFTWNIFTFGAEGKYGITPDQENPRTIAYFRASVRELVLTYPLLAGIGITAGEQMRDKGAAVSKEQWLWRTYGEGIRDALKLQPGRNVRLIHRYHQTGQEEIFREFKDYPGPFDLSFKYSIAHMYSIPNPPYIRDLLPNLPAGRRTWLTVRNDDVYSFRWGNPAYAREYIRNIPGPDKIAGFYMGPDGYVWGREFLARNPGSPRQTVIGKQWYSFLLWGRLSYDPALPDGHFEKILAARFSGVNAARLAAAWSSASMVFPLITRFFWGDIDLRWFPEACLSHPRYRGYYTVRDFATGITAPGSGVLTIREWRKRMLAGEPMNGVTPLEIAAELEKNAAAALGELPGLRAAGAKDPELAATAADIEAMAHLSRYYSLKIRAAAALAVFDRTREAAQQQAAVKDLEAAVTAWRTYAKVYTDQYVQPRLYNRVGFVDLPALTARAQDDVRLARGWQPGSMPGDTVERPGEDRPFRK